MKRPIAYITAAWSGDARADTQLAAGYCRAVYEAGFSPVCPMLYLPLFLNDAVVWPVLRSSLWTFSPTG